MMSDLLFFDIETTDAQQVVEIGVVNSNGMQNRYKSFGECKSIFESAKYIVGHNILEHDLKFVPATFDLSQVKFIDTLRLSPLLFPKAPYHHLGKEEKFSSDDLNDPIIDSIKAKELFFDEVDTFRSLPVEFQEILIGLIGEREEFYGFLEFLGVDFEIDDLKNKIETYFANAICQNTDLQSLIDEFPVQLGYALALINCSDRYSLTPKWLVYSFPEIERILFQLRNKPCITGCPYCDQFLDAETGLKQHFGFPSFRQYGGKPLQKDAVTAALNNKSLLAVFPTGGGKSITFQLPALMAGENEKGLTVVISPLQSLMKDQVDNLEQQGISEAVTVNGLLDPIERSKSFERIQNGQASLLYISPESLRSRSMEKALLGRNVVRFVIDEAHCFSSWGHDFRVDYLYIADFIKNYQEKKNRKEPIPVSCFTATAKQKVINDILAYFKDNLGLHLELFTSKAARVNLTYNVFPVTDDTRYLKLRELIEGEKCPIIVYVSRTGKARDLSTKLAEDGCNVRMFHGKMEAADKTENQNSFLAGDTQVMVATSAFGMGVDKKDVGLVIHYEISDSLENYVQEAGRAGRDETLQAKCYVLYNEEDLHKHFVLLNQTKLTHKEVQQIWLAMKNLTKSRNKVSISALEIARFAGWDEDVYAIETRVTTAISGLEQSGYVKRTQNTPRVFATSILAKSAQQAIEIIHKSNRYKDQGKQDAIRVIKRLFSSKFAHANRDDEGETRVDYLSDQLGIKIKGILQAITLLKDLHILADEKDLTAFLKVKERLNSILNIVKAHLAIEQYLLETLQEGDNNINLKEINEGLHSLGEKAITPKRIKTILIFWKIQGWISYQKQVYSNNHFRIQFKESTKNLKEKVNAASELSSFIVNHLWQKKQKLANDSGKEEVLINFSVFELKNGFEQENALLGLKATVDQIENTLFYLSKIGAIKIEGGFLVLYNRLNIEKLETNNSIQYKKEDYKRFENFYTSKVQQIHVVGEYANKMLTNVEEATQYVEDYFHLNGNSFLNKYFAGSRRDEIKLNITPTKFKQLMGGLSPVQREIVEDKTAQNIVVLAGPGSGKTKVLVHKLASLLLMEDVKHEQLLMLTFSRTAVTEFKTRLRELIGNAAFYLGINTFHAFCFDLLGQVGDLDKSAQVIPLATQKIRNKEVEQSKITKAVLVLDEAQDINIEEFDLIAALMEANPEMRVVAVGDDDQNIYEFRGADSRLFFGLLSQDNSRRYELLRNYRSKPNLIDFSNQYIERAAMRFKSNVIHARQNKDGVISITKVSDKQNLNALVHRVLKADLTGTTAILTNTNEDAFTLAGVLNNNSMPARLIQNKHASFKLTHLLELRTFFTDLNLLPDAQRIPKENWNEAKKQFARKYKTSANYGWCVNLLKDFQDNYPKHKFVSDFKEFLLQSRMEDFMHAENEEITVSTIHKAKGREFDNVFLCLRNFQVNSNDSERAVYVALTRAKSNLHIFTGGNLFDRINMPDIQYPTTKTHYPDFNTMEVELGYTDVHLGYFPFVQPRIRKLLPGSHLTVLEKALGINQEDKLVKFSARMNEKISHYQSLGFEIESASISQMFYWDWTDAKTEKTKEIIVVLPRIKLKKK